MAIVADIGTFNGYRESSRPAPRGNWSTPVGVLMPNTLSRLSGEPSGLRHPRIDGDGARRHADRSECTICRSGPNKPSTMDGSGDRSQLEHVATFNAAHL